MMTITAAEVNKLRKETGAGMMDCKHALVEADGDFDKAIDILRKKGQKVAAKRADRESNEGRIIAKVNADRTAGALLMLACETDFVAKTDDFIRFVDNILEHAMQNQIKTREELLEMPIDGRKVADLLLDMTGKTGEKIELPHYDVMEAACVDAYNHTGNRLATLVAFNKTGDPFVEAAHNVAKQVAAMNPVALDKSAVPQSVIDHEMEINRELVRQEGKPEAMVEKIAQGKLNKFFKESTLLYQDYVIGEGKQSVADYIKSVDKDFTCLGFVRRQLGA